MVGGLAVLFIGVFLVDFGVLSVSLADEPHVYILLYLAGWNAFSGLISLLRAAEIIRNKGRSWKMNALYGVVNIAVSIACFMNYGNLQMLTLLYCAGLGYSGLLRIFASPGKSATSYFAVGGFAATMICLILVPKLEWFAKTKEERSHHKQQKKLHKARQS